MKKIVQPKKIINTYSNFAQQLLRLDGEPFSLNARPHLDQIYNHNKKRTLLMFSRQTEKSTTLAAKSITRSCIHPYFKTLYVAPRGAQVKQFSDQKIKPFVEDSPKVKENFQDKESKTAVFYKSFSNGSDYTLRSAFLSPDAARGISADALYFDELQDMIPDHIPVIESCIQHCKPWAGFVESCGTPKTMQNFIQKQWERSKQIEWIVRCNGCKNHNLLSMDNIGLHHLICSRCGKQIYPHDGQWVVTNPEGSFAGFRICYLMVPWCVWDNPDDPSEFSVRQMMRDWPEDKFRNETLAESCDNATCPITEKEFKACCEEDRSMVNLAREIPKKYSPVYPFFAGIDWGTSEEKKSRTVLSIGAFCTDGKFRIFYWYKFGATESDPIYQVEYIYKVLMQWNVQFVGSDWGFAYMQNAELNAKLPPGRLQIMYTSGNQKHGVIKEQKVGYYSISRSQTLTNLFISIKHQQTLFPKWKDTDDHRKSTEFFAQDFLSIGQEYNEKTRMVHYVHPTGVPDDAMHSVNYCRCAGLIAKGDFTVARLDHQEYS